jgi:chromosome condensin MukBEF complex kleisin-like MukF subunit
MAAKEATLKINITLELSEDQLRDIFESYDIKFTKKKVKELQDELDNAGDSVQMELEEAFEEIAGNMINEFFSE